MASIATLLAGKDNTTSATIETLESSRERASVVGFSLIILPDQENGAAMAQALRRLPAAMRWQSTRNIAMPIQRISRQ